MPVAWASLREYLPDVWWQTSFANPLHSNIKGNASHKIISDGEHPDTYTP